MTNTFSDERTNSLALHLAGGVTATPGAFVLVRIPDVKNEQAREHQPYRLRHILPAGLVQTAHHEVV